MAGDADASGPHPDPHRPSADAAPPPADADRRGPPHTARRRLLPTLLLVAALLLGLGIGGGLAVRWPGLGDLFGARTTDRSQPVLLRAVRDLSRLTAAEGSYQVVVDLQRSRRYVPDFLLDERTLFVGAGTVEAYVELGALAGEAVTVTGDRRGATVRLPAPQLAPARLDLGRSYVFAERRGVLNRLGEVFGGSPDRQRQVYALGEQRIAEAAVHSGLPARAQDSARRTLESLLRGLGFTSVEVSFAASA